jgi:hypothetical protein
MSVAARVVPVDVPEAFLARHTVLPSSVERWRSAYAIDFLPLEAYARSGHERIRVSLDEVRSWPMVGDAVTLVDQQLAQADGSPIQVHADVVIAAPAAHLGLLCTFDAVVAPGLVLSSAPGQAPPQCSWRGLLAYVGTRRHVVAGDVVSVTYSFANGSPVFQACL